jgi:hypothetical protein
MFYYFYGYRTGSTVDPKSAFVSDDRKALEERREAFLSVNEEWRATGIRMQKNIKIFDLK